MNVSELIDLLKDYDGDAEVRLATQVQWPFEYTVQSVASADEVAAIAGEDEAPNIVYIAEGEQLGYLPEPARAVWNIN